MRDRHATNIVMSSSLAPTISMHLLNKLFLFHFLHKYLIAVRFNQFHIQTNDEKQLKADGIFILGFDLR